MVNDFHQGREEITRAEGYQPPKVRKRVYLQAYEFLYELKSDVFAGLRTYLVCHSLGPLQVRR